MNSTQFCIVLLSLLALSSFAIAGRHIGDARPLDYSIEYYDFNGLTDSVETPDPTLWGFPLYYQFETMRYRIHIQNHSNRTYNHLRVRALQEYYLTTGANRGELMPGNAVQTFSIDSLKPGQEVILSGEFYIGDGLPGFDETHLLIEHWASENGNPADNTGRVIVDDSTAGLWCPPASH